MKKRFIVCYADSANLDSWSVDAEFDSLKAAQKYIEKRNVGEEADDYTGDVSWEYHIFEWVSGVKAELEVTRKFKTFNLCLK